MDGPQRRKRPPGQPVSFGHLVAAQVQGLFAGHAPVVGLLPQLVVLQGSFVVDGKPLDGVRGKSLEEQRADGGSVSRGYFSRVAAAPRLAHLQVDDSVCAVAFHGEELQVSLEVLGVETGDGKTVAKTSLRRGSQA